MTMLIFGVTLMWALIVIVIVIELGKYLAGKPTTPAKKQRRSHNAKA